MNRTTLASAVAAATLALVMACSETPRAPTSPTPPTTDVPPTAPNPPQPPPPGPPSVPSGQSVTVIAVGDIGMCDRPAVAETARLVEGIDGQILLAGDLAYMQGTPTDFIRCFDPSWGQFRRRWRPVPGNHEYETRDAAGYFQYFGAAASGPGGRTFYSFRTGDWLVLMLNSNVAAGRGSEQFEFVRQELTTQATPCTMAVWHHPLFSSGPNGPNNFMRDMYGLLYEKNADVLVVGHDHLYERFGKQDVDGRSDVRGLRQFTVGTGGAFLYQPQRQEPNSQVRISAHGVMRMTLHTNNYEWAFIDTAGRVADMGGDGCH